MRFEETKTSVIKYAVMGRLLGDVHQWFHCWDLEPVVNHIDVHDFLFTEAGRGAGGDVDAAVAREKKKKHFQL